MKKRKTYSRVIVVLLSLCMIWGNVGTAMAEKASATTLRLTKTEGEVGISNANGRMLTAIKDMKLYNGYHVETQEESYAWVNLDSTKLVKLDAVSEMEIRQKEKVLELLLNSGNLYFNVTAPLTDDETLNIRTSTMVTGIRGTAGWVKVINKWHTKVFILEGTVRSSVTDPVSGQTKWITLRGGQMADFYVYDKNKKGDKCDIIIKAFAEDDIDGFVAAEFLQDSDLSGRIEGSGSGLNVRKITKGAKDRLAADQAQVHQQLTDIQAQLSHQDANIMIDPVFVDNAGNSGESDSGRSGGGSSDSGGNFQGPTEPDPTPTESESTPTESEPAPTETESIPAESEPAPTESESAPTESESAPAESEPAPMESEPAPTESEPAPTESESTPAESESAPTESESAPEEQGTVELTMKVTAAEVNEYLKTKNVVLKPGANPADNTLNIDVNVTVPADKTLTMENGVHMDVRTGQALQIDGTLDMAGNVTNNGTIRNTSMNTFKVGGSFITNGTIQNTGRIVSADAINNSGTLVNKGKIEGNIVNTGVFEMAGGTVGNGILQTEGNIELSGGTIQKGVEVNGGDITLTGGTIENPDGTGALKLLGGAASFPEGSTAFINGGIRVSNSGDQIGKLKMSGGTVIKGSAEAALLITNHREAPEDHAPEILLYGGSLDGEDGMIIRSDSGGTEADGVELKADHMDSVVVAENNGKVWFFNHDQDEAERRGIPVEEGTVFTCRQKGGKYILSRAAVDIIQALNAASGGEMVKLNSDWTQPKDYGGEGPSDLLTDFIAAIWHGTREEPVILDLNGCILEVNEIQVGMRLEDGSSVGGALSIIDSSGKRGTLRMHVPISNYGFLELKNGNFANICGGAAAANYGELLADSGAMLKNSLETDGRDEAPRNIILEIEEGTAILRGNVSLFSDIELEWNEFFNETIRLEKGTLLLEDAEINAGLEGALYVGEEGTVTIGAGAALTSLADWGTVRLEKGGTAVYAGGSIVNAGGHALVWYGGKENVSLPKELETDIKSELEDVAGYVESRYWDASETDRIQPAPLEYYGYQTEEMSDGYWHIVPAAEGAALMNVLEEVTVEIVTAPSETVYEDEILDEDGLPEEDEIPDEGEAPDEGESQPTDEGETPEEDESQLPEEDEVNADQDTAITLDAVYEETDSEEEESAI